MFLARTTAAAAGVASVGLVGYGAATALGPPQVLQVPVRLGRLDPAFNGFRIAVVSDIHLGPLLGRRHTERIVRMINETDADLVAIVGDLVDGSVEKLGHARGTAAGLGVPRRRLLRHRQPRVLLEDTAPWLRELERLGVSPLRNENARSGAVAQPSTSPASTTWRAQRRGPPDFDRALAGVDPSRRDSSCSPTSRSMVDEAAERGVDLQLSGHTHGGQTWPFQYIVDAVQPSLAGLSRIGTPSCTSARGAGFWGPPVRVGAPPDISVLTLNAVGQPDAQIVRRAVRTAAPDVAGLVAGAGTVRAVGGEPSDGEIKPPEANRSSASAEALPTFSTNCDGHHSHRRRCTRPLQTGSHGAKSTWFD